MVFDHALFNYAADASRMPILLRIPYILDGYGYLSSIVLYLLILVTLILEQQVLRKGRQHVEHLRLLKNRVRLLKGALKSPLEIPVHLIAIIIYAQARRALIYGGYTREPEKVDTKRRESLNSIARRLELLKAVLELPDEGAAIEDESMASSTT
jgi:hypothetical protein